MDILSCPFCGHDDVEVSEVEIRRYAIDCPVCGCLGPVMDSVEDAVNRWNRVHARNFSLEAEVKSINQWWLETATCR